MRLGIRFTGALLSVGTALAVVPGSAGADPIRVTGGMVYDVAAPPPRIELHADARGFSLLAFPNLSPFAPCALADCTPGALIPIDTGWSDSDLPGMASLDGSTFRVGLPTEEQGAAAVFFSGPLWTAPAFSGSMVATIMTPFVLSGRIAPPMPEGEAPTSFALAGSGVATLMLAWNAPTEAWTLTGAAYQLSAEPAPVPEPATALLLGAGLAGAAWRRRRIRQAPR